MFSFFSITFQGNGDVVAYYTDSSGALTAYWNTKTGGKGVPQGLTMQGDGNLVLTGPGGVAWWASGSNNKGGVAPFNLELQGDGNLVHALPKSYVND